MRFDCDKTGDVGSVIDSCSSSSSSSWMCFTGRMENLGVEIRIFVCVDYGRTGNGFLYASVE